MACLQKPGSCQTDQLQDTPLNIPVSTKIFISANEEWLLPDCILDVDWKKACVDTQAASFTFYTTTILLHPNKLISDSSEAIKKLKIYLLVPDFKSIRLEEQMRETWKDRAAAMDIYLR